MQNGDEALPSIFLVGRVHLVKMLIILEPHGIFGSNFAYIFILNIDQPLVCKMVMRLCRALFWLVEVFNF